MNTDIIRVMMHPVRIKIIQELSLKGSATTKEIQNACGECAQATLYRHIKELLKHELIQVVSENNVNGIVEKVYAIKRNVTHEIAQDPTKLSKEDYLNLFSQYIMAILTDFSSCIEHLDIKKEVMHNIGFSSNTIFLTDEELNEMMHEISQSFMKRLRNEPKPGRKMRKISNIITTTLD